MWSKERLSYNKEITIAMNFYDIHCHLMNLGDPDFIVFMKQMVENIGKETLNSMKAPDYFIDVRNKNFSTKIGNLINVMSHEQWEMAMLIDDDLNGKFSESGETYCSEGKFQFNGKTYDKYVITPLIMDFNSNIEFEGLHYSSKPRKNAFTYANGMLESTQLFYEQRPNSMLEILPFAGINPPAYTMEMIITWFERYFKDFTSKKSDQNREKPRFYGIKLYPPLGTDPLPKDPLELEKMHYIYSMASEKRIPITTHCDDEGYRITDVELSHSNTSPHTWEKVLIEYPKLKLNFAHFGKQYQRNMFMMSQTEWRSHILELMTKYQHVFADVSFNGAIPDYYTNLNDFYKNLKTNEQESLKTKLMFGTDFMIHLSKVSSYIEYLNIFRDSELNEAIKHEMVNSNCEQFLFE